MIRLLSGLFLISICLSAVAEDCPSQQETVQRQTTQQQTTKTKRRPNIILFFADDLGYGELGCQGNKQIPTPHIDSLAKNGIRMTNGYVTAAYCSSSRAGLLTGKFQTRFGYEFNPIGEQNEDPNVGLPPSQWTIAEHLQSAGYTTACIGKWHLGGTAAYHPFRHGFDEFFGFLHEGHYFVPPPYRNVTTLLRRQTLPDGGAGRWTSKDGRLTYTTHMGYNEPDYDANNPITRGGQPVEEREYLTDALTREAVDFLEQNQEKPFFLYLSYNAVHSPMQGADAYMKKFAHIPDIHRRIFAAMLANMDDSVGTVMNTLRELHLEEDTLIFFISDNGGPTRELTSSNLPLRGGKGQVYEGGIRVPFIVQWKGTVPANRVYHQPVVSLDVFGTAAAIAKRPLKRNQKIDGVNVLPFLTGEQSGSPHETLFWRMQNKTALRHGTWKLVRDSSRKAGKGWELYDLSEDLSETTDVAGKFPEKLGELKLLWEKWNAEMQEPFWKRPTPR